MEHDPQLRGALGHNDFAHRIELLKDLPWRSMTNSIYWSDPDDAALRHYLERGYDVNHVGKTMDALSVIVEQNRHHPVREYLNSLVWDGVKRLDTMLIDFFGAKDCEYTRAVTKKTMCAAVARIFSPGCKFDYMLLMIGKQGLGKSYFIKKLGGKWYSDSLTTVTGKEAYEQLQGVWIIEMGELAAAKKAEVDALKHFISKQEDIFREAYGRRTGVFPRQCIFIGTTNDYECLRDKTGGRRFWPVNVGDGGKQSLWQDLNVDQLWAEAIVVYKTGETLYLPDELEAYAQTIQAEHTEESDKAGMVYEYLDTLIPEGWDTRDLGERRMFLSRDFTGGEGTLKRTRVCAMEVWCECFGGDPKQLSNAQSREIRSILDHAEGWRRYEGVFRFKLYGRQRAYLRA
jgi:putative DNA primase/helicase